ncbi:HTH domain-containing protein [Solibacillus cecembensis]|uniref:HTH domain-containing protein n=1 Tax=Solibacillus cecembensis TaxID=459347 RepID=UPI003CFE66FA
MSKQLFSLKQIEQLQKNPHVLKVTERTITYADAFKSQFIEEYLAGKTPKNMDLTLKCFG